MLLLNKLLFTLITVIIHISFNISLSKSIDQVSPKPGVYLISAAKKNNVKAFIQILNNNISINHKDKSGLTSLMWASYLGNKEIVEVALKYKANPNIQCKLGRTSIMLAVGQGHEKVVEILILNGADPKIKDKYEVNAINLAKSLGKYNILKIFQENGYN